MKDVFPIRLRNARKMKGWSFRDLSKAMEGEISPTALEKYEKGKIFPSSRVMIKLSQALGLSIDDFFRPFKVNIDLSQVKYRKKASLGKKKQDAINSCAANELEKYLEVEQMCRESSIFSADFSDIEVQNENDVLSIAARFRKYFNLGESPISKPIEMLESAGVKIIEIDAPAGFDANSFTTDGLFVIILNKELIEERKRFTLFHEVGHKVMRFAGGIDEERFCHVFANEVLLPSSVFIQKIGKIRKDISLVELKDLQGQYGISVDALMVKARQAGIISKNRYVSFCKRKNAVKSFKAKVEESIFPEEHCRRYERLVFKLFANEEITDSKCASLLGKTVDEVRNQLNLV